jgi:hypothetical protein
VLQGEGATDVVPPLKTMTVPLLPKVASSTPLAL